jgi:hypothetical protein
MTKLMSQFRTLKTINLDIYRAVWPDRVELYCLRTNPGWSNGFSVSMKTIELTGKHGKGMVALVDDEDYDRVSKHKWFAKYHKRRKIYNAAAKIKSKGVLMHRFIMGVTDPSILVDHIFGNTLDNRREKLRLATSAQNAANSPKEKDKSSRFKGVSWVPRLHCWVSQITAENKTTHLGCFLSEEAAALEWNKAALIYHGEFAYLNQLSDNEQEIAARYPKKETSSKYHGVHWNKREKKWKVVIWYNKKSVYVGSFKLEKDAAIAYNRTVVPLFGEKAKVNILSDDFA